MNNSYKPEHHYADWLGDVEDREELVARWSQLASRLPDDTKINFQYLTQFLRGDIQEANPKYDSILQSALKL